MKAVKRTAGALLALVIVMNPVIFKIIESDLPWRKAALLGVAYAGACAVVVGLFWLIFWLLFSGD